MFLVPGYNSGQKFSDRIWPQSGQKFPDRVVHKITKSSNCQINYTSFKTTVPQNAHDFGKSWMRFLGLAIQDLIQDLLLLLLIRTLNLQQFLESQKTKKETQDNHGILTPITPFIDGGAGQWSTPAFLQSSASVIHCFMWWSPPPSLAFEAATEASSKSSP